MNARHASLSYPSIAPVRSRDLHSRIRAEFLEMPGLRLTVQQAARFFHLEVAECERVLSDLVRTGELRLDGSMFVTAGSGRN
jgi:Fic family protein